jgi:hypothetical protein
MKTWHLIALGVGAFAVARAVNSYRASHYQTPGPGNDTRLTWLQGFEGVFGLARFPAVVSVPAGAAVTMLPTPNPAAGIQGLG